MNKSAKKGGLRVPSLAYAPPRKTVALLYLASVISIILLAWYAYYLTLAQQKLHTQFNPILTVLSQQRMLSQRVSLFCVEYETTLSQSSKQTAHSALQALQDNHAFILAQLAKQEETPDNLHAFSQLHGLFYAQPVNYQLKFSRFISLISQALERTSPREPSLQQEYVVLAKVQILNAIDAIVTHYQAQYDTLSKRMEQSAFTLFGLTFLAVVLQLAFVFYPLFKRLWQYVHRLQYDANHDLLSDLLNLRAFHSLSSRLFSSSRRYHHPLTLVIFDINDFKAINQTYGREAGEKVIVWVADTIKSQIRQSDWAARIGTDQFALLLVHTDREGAKATSEKICRAITESRADFLTDNDTISLEVGIAEYRSGDTAFSHVLKRAETALCKAKSEKRKTQKAA